MLSIARLRYWFAAAAILIAAVVAGFYLYARLRAYRDLSGRPSDRRLGVEVQQSTQEFSLSKSEGGRTLFTVRAARATQYKQGGRAELKDVNIVVYGRDSSRFDQIYGSDFAYDPQAGDVTAQGVVHIDLEANSTGAAQPDQAPPQELKNPIHLLTSGLTFNQKSGDAATRERIEFRLPEASGWAEGATYASRPGQLTLERDVHLTVSGTTPSQIVAQRALLTKTPRRVVLYTARIDRQNTTLNTAELTLYLRDDNSVERALASGGLESTTKGPTTLTLHAPQAVLYAHGHDSAVQSANILGGVTFVASGANTMSGRSDSVILDYGARNQLDKVHAQGNVKLTQPPHRARSSGSGSQAQTVDLAANAIDFWLGNGNQLCRAETSRAAQITLTPQNGRPGERTVATADKFYGAFDGHNRLTSMKGAPQARVVSYAPAQPDQVSTSDNIDVAFGPAGGVSGVVQRGNFRFHEHLPNGSDRDAWSDTASYSPEAEILTLEGKPRIVEGGMTTTAHLVRINRRNGEARGDGDVKTTYNEVKPQPGGALLASGDPVHVTARSMTAQRASGLLHYQGDARLWQGANIIEAPTIDFDRDRRTVLAQGDNHPSAGKSSRPAGPGTPGGGRRVATVLTQQDKAGKQAPANITSSRLTYNDAQRLARFEGGVVVRSSDGTLTANTVDVFLKPAADGGRGFTLAPSSSNQVDHLVAEGNVVLQQPNRRASGGKLVYTAADDKYVLTGGPPSLFDAEHGTVTGAALTFYNRDDRVLVEGGGSRAVTQTRVPK